MIDNRDWLEVTRGMSLEAANALSDAIEQADRVPTEARHGGKYPTGPDCYTTSEPKRKGDRER